MRVGPVCCVCHQPSGFLLPFLWKDANLRSGELGQVIEELSYVTDEPLLKRGWGVGRGNKSWLWPSANCQVSYREA